MAVTHDSAPFRSTALRPGAPALVAEAVREAWSRRRLIRYLVQADLKKKGADTLLGNLWWVLDPLLQMVVYVVLVSVVFQRSIPDYPLFIFAAILPWKWFTSSVGDAITSVTSQERLIKQIQFPKIVLPVASTVAGLVNFAFGFIRLAVLLVALYADRISATLVLLPGHRRRPVRLHPRDRVPRRGDERLLPRHRQRRPPRPAAVVLPVAGPLLRSTRSQHISQDAPWLGTLFSLNPFAILFTAYREVIYGETTPDWAPARSRCSALSCQLVLLALTTVAVQAGRAVVRQGPLMAERRPHRPSGAPAAPSRSATSASSTACASPARRRSTARSRTSSAGATDRASSGRCATSRSGSSTASRWRVIGPNGAGKSTLLQVARRDHPAVGRRRSTSTARSRAC